MGAVSIDTEAKARRLESEFPMHTREGVVIFLEEYHNTREVMFLQGDYDALIMMVDFEIALHNSNLSSKEWESIKRVYVHDIKRVDVAKQFNVTKQTVQKWLERGLDKIARYYQETGNLNEI